MVDCKNIFNSISGFLSLNNKKGLDINIINLGIPDRIISHGSQDELYREIGLDKKSLEIKINELYNHITQNEKVIK